MISLTLAENPFQILIALYVILAVTHLGVQAIMAHLNYTSQRRAAPHLHQLVLSSLNSGTLPTISVIYPIYREDPVVLEKVMQRAKACLQIPGLEVIFVDDGSPNIDELRPLYDKYASSSAGLKVLYKRNGGKRDAQYYALDVASGEYIITVDSDTLIDSEGILRLIAPMVRDERLGAVTGDVRVQNRNENLLSRLIGLRYWLAFNLERAAQSFSGTMLCCSGPFSAYRRDVLETVKDRYVNQTFLGKLCTYGDDRHLTNLVICEGYKSAFQQDAIAYTFVPTTIGEYITQQTRWSKSFYREMLWTYKAFWNFSLYSLWEMTLQLILFVMFVLVLGSDLFNFLNTLDMKIPLYYLTLLVVMASVRSVYGLLRTRNLGFLLFAFYGFLHVAILMPVRFKALLTLKDNRWGTRCSSLGNNVYVNFGAWLSGYLACVGGVAAMIALSVPDRIVENVRSLDWKVGASISDFVGSVGGSWSYAVVPFIVLGVIFGGLRLYSSSSFSRRRGESAVAIR